MHLCQKFLDFQNTGIQAAIIQHTYTVNEGDQYYRTEDILKELLETTHKWPKRLKTLGMASTKLEN